MSIWDELRARAQDYREPDSIGPLLADAAAEGERLQTIVDRYEPPPGQCEHGVQDGDWCEPCNREYKLASREHEADEKVRKL